MINHIQTILFDWGGTLMTTTPEYEGKMRDWPVVNAIEHAREVVEQLSQQYSIIVATNAQDSSADDVRAAFERVDLNSHIQRIFTRSELKAQKPALGFYRELCVQLGNHPSQCLMVGDDYLNDIVPAAETGMHTIWFNPGNKVAPGHIPLQESECDSLTQIPSLLKKKPYPSYMQCLSWYAQQGASHYLLSHVNTVAAASYQMAIWFREAGVPVSALLAHRGGFLHDLAKLREIEGLSHAESAARLLMGYEQPEIAEIARRHLIGNLVDPEQQPHTWEEKIVNYCDKLVEGNQLISLDERLLALRNRYPKFAEKIIRNTPLVKKLESEITSVLIQSPSILLENLRKALYNSHPE